MKIDNRIWIVIVVIAILAIGAYLYLDSGPVVSAQGVATIKVVPDEVSVNVNVETHNKTAQEAQDSNNLISQNLLLEMTKLGYSQDELKFVNYNVYPEYDWINNQQIMKGYVVSQQLVVKTNESGKVPSIVDGVISSGALVSYIDFEVSDAKQAEYKNQALEQASEDAKTKAESIAAGQGKSVGRLVSITNQDYNYPGPVPVYSMGANAPMAESNAGAAKAAVNLAPEEQDITATISAQYKLGMF